jgi:hypothetical protein
VRLFDVQVTFLCGRAALEKKSTVSLSISQKGIASWQFGKGLLFEIELIKEVREPGETLSCHGRRQS